MANWYEMSPSTARSAKKLSRAYGFDSPEALATSLPDNALVIDVGSGKSKFGHTIAGLRPDIRWVNVDLRNGRRRPMRRLHARAPSNLHYVGGDVLNLPIAPESAQRVYSTALLPHIALDSSELAGEAFVGMAALLAVDGEIAYNGFAAIPNSAYHVTASEFHANPEGVSLEAVDQMTLDPAIRGIQKVLNFVGHITLTNC